MDWYNNGQSRGSRRRKADRTLRSVTTRRLLPEPDPEPEIRGVSDDDDTEKSSEKNSPMNGEANPDDTESGQVWYSKDWPSSKICRVYVGQSTSPLEQNTHIK